MRKAQLAKRHNASDQLADLVNVEAIRAGMHVAALIHATAVAHLDAVKRGPDEARG